MVSDSFLAQVFLEFLSTHPNSRARKIKDSKNILYYFEQFLPILFHPKNSELLEEWFQDKGRSASYRWKFWYDLCKDFFKHISSQKMIHKSGLKSFLIHELSQRSISFPKKKIKIDLAFSLDESDLVLLKEFSSQNELTFIVPDLKKDTNIYKDSLDIYKTLFNEIPPSCIQSFSKESKKETRIFKQEHKTCLEEVKKVTLQVRQWLEQGVKESQIVLLAPQIEDYWFALQAHLKKENIRVKKSVTARFIDFPFIRYWLASLNLHLGFLDFSKLEEYSFYDNPTTSFSYFFSQYSKAFRLKDIQYRLKKSSQKTAHQKVKGKEFIHWALSFLPQKEALDLDFIYQSFQAFPLDFELKWSSWLKLLELEIFSKTKQVLEEPSEGISCLSFNAMDSVRGQYICALGLDEDSLQNFVSSSITQKDRDALFSDLGFALSEIHPKEKEYNLFWFLQSSHFKEVVLNFSKTNFLGQILTPSSFYIFSETKEKRELNISQNSWESQNRQKDLDSLLKNSSKQTTESIQDFFKYQESPYPIKNLALSHKKLNLFSECPFKYAMEYLFYIKDLNVLDREMSALDAGSLIHKIFEQILKQKSLDLSRQDLEKIIDSAKPEDKKFLNQKQWDIYKESILQLSSKFLEKEIQKRKESPHLKPRSFEKSIEAFWNKETSELDSKGSYPFRGKVDRIDYNEKEGGYLMLDYKGSSLDNMDSWLKDTKENFQLFLYAQALEKGLIQGIKKGSRIFGALYYSYKDFSYKGYVEDADAFRYSFWKGKKFFKKRELFDDLLKKSNLKITQNIESMEKGKFYAIPKDPKSCDRCSWRKRCRAHHFS